LVLRQCFVALSFPFPGIIKPRTRMKKTVFPGNTMIDAANDYLFLLDKGYSQRSVLKMVGDRYKLSGTERSVLYRGLSPSVAAANRSEKQVYSEFVRQKELHIDGFNVLITIGSYLNGDFVFVGNDSILRDSAEVHGKIFKTQLLDKGILLIFSFLETLSPSGVFFYFDEPVSHSGDLCNKINELLSYFHLEGQAITHKSPDYLLKTAETGVISTSDTVVIDRCKVPVYDLSFNVLNFHYHPRFHYLQSYLSSYHTE
jgi:hypothetical protein